MTLRCVLARAFVTDGAYLASMFCPSWTLDNPEDPRVMSVSVLDFMRGIADTSCARVGDPR